MWHRKCGFFWRLRPAEEAGEERNQSLGTGKGASSLIASMTK